MSQQASVEPEARLVVVDDEPNIRELLAASLGFAGFDVVAAESGEEAVRTVERHRPDKKMPGGGCSSSIKWAA